MDYGETFDDELACPQHLEHAVDQAVGLSHGLDPARVFRIAPRPDRHYPNRAHPHTGYDIAPAH